MLESLYITFAILAFIMTPVSFFVGKEKLAAQMILLGFSLILFGALAMASANVEIVTCTSTTCVKTSFFFQENMFIFAFLGIITGALFLIKSFDAFYFAKGRL